ncbi:M14 family zinc carboxypeptidase [uncultured Paludibaculum sp.]|uniref:M14 family zinc carboxypeptidase n=1 Tax=uncultured Paludibaculum sp. TaxID=1765020 RepID=UPI002AAC2582|nr:M14 family zinc carboxypeptidase [uncultured Paludibaculum sp.]
MRKLLVSLSLLTCALSAQQAEFWPGTQYDQAIPTVEKVLGYAIGTRIAPPADIVKYFEALAAAAPARIQVHDYARTWEGRRLIYAVVSSEENIRNLETIKANQLKLADPRKTPAAEAKQLMATMPAILSLSYGVHGNEISSPDAAMMTAYHLLAARGDQMIDNVLKHVVVVIDPSQNPDGRERFVQNFQVNLGLLPDENPVAAERAEPWPGGRTNHYFFDMNRDWHAITQPETRGRIQYLRQFLPLVQVDLHEMGGNSSYFFTPGSLPYNPNLTQDQKTQMNWFGKNDAKWFDKFGWPYFTREVYDEFYPGYGASWPWFYGGMGMTYENASVRGLVLRRSDDALYTFQESVKKHFVASIATCETALDYREKLLDSFYRYQVTAIEEGQKEAVKEFILPRRGDAGAVDKLAHILAEHGIEVRQAKAAFKNGGKDYGEGSYSVILAQPRKRFIHALLDPNTPMEPDFLKEQERRRKKKLPDQIYDVTGWNLPMSFGVECIGAAEVSQGSFEPVSGVYTPHGSVSGRAEVAYLVPWGTQAAGRFLTAALRADLRVLTANKAFTQSGRKYPSGTLIVMVKQNAATVHEKVATIATASGADVVATNTGWVDDGVNFGSGNVGAVKKPAIAMVWDSPTSSASAGQTRFVLERQFGYPVSVIRSSSFGTVDFGKFQVLILPSGGYAGAFSPAVTDRIKNWVRGGGVLVGLGAAVTYLSSPQVGLLGVAQEGLAPDTGRPADAAKPSPTGGSASAARPATDSTAAAGPPSATAPTGPAPGKIFNTLADYEKAIQAERELPDAVAGVLVRAKVDPETWITAGLPETLYVLVDGRAIYSPAKLDRGSNPILYAGPNELVASGYLWEENRKQLAYKPFLTMQGEGRGMIVGFTSDPNFRAYMDGLNVAFLNAVFRYTGGGVRGGSEQEQEQQQ